MINLLPGTEQTERFRIRAAPDCMLQRCPVCAADVEAFVMYDHLLKADFERALLADPWSVRRDDYSMRSSILEPCNHPLIVPFPEPPCMLYATPKSDGGHGPPYLVLWSEKAKTDML